MRNQNFANFNENGILEGIYFDFPDIQLLMVILVKKLSLKILIIFRT